MLVTTGFGRWVLFVMNDVRPGEQLHKIDRVCNFSRYILCDVCCLRRSMLVKKRKNVKSHNSVFALHTSPWLVAGGWWLPMKLMPTICVALYFINEIC